MGQTLPNPEDYQLGTLFLDSTSGAMYASQKFVVYTPRGQENHYGWVELQRGFQAGTSCYCCGAIVFKMTAHLTMCAERSRFRWDWKGE